MDKTTKSFWKNEKMIVFLVFLVPTVMLVIGYVLNPYPPSADTQQSIYIPLFLGLLFLGLGFFWKRKNMGSTLKLLGWGTFSFYWATQPSFLYYSESGDIFNATVCIIGVYVLIYLGYHEWLSIQRNETISCLNWIAGGTFLAGIIYFTVDSGFFPLLKNGLINIVTAQSVGVLKIIGLNAHSEGAVIFYNTTVINIIFACTAIQAMVVFIGMNGTLSTISSIRKIGVILCTVISIYFLNLVRNASVVYLVGNNITSFNIAHNYLAKAGSLLTLIALLFINFKLVPQLYNEIYGIIDLPKRNGPVELTMRRLWGKKHVLR